MAPSDIPGEELSKTQPFPTRPPPFDQQGIAEDDLLSSSGRADRGGRLVAYDKATGALVGAVALPGAPLGTPMTYAIRGNNTSR